jgi:hypothetical protein
MILRLPNSLSLAIACLLLFHPAAGEAGRIQPSDLRYLGAFRLPDSPATPDNVGWEWSNWAGAATYYPDGDPGGPGDGYPGSLYGVGHDQTQYVSEVSIPVPRVSATKNVAELNTAGILQDFKDIRGGLYGYFEMPRVGLAYLPPQGAQTSGKLYFSWAEHLDEGSTEPTHGWCELDLANPQSRGIWRIGGYVNYVTADYMFEIPSAWTGAYTPGYRLVTGRYRDGGQAAQGPALFTFGPWNQGNPPANGATLTSKPLLLYNGILDPEQYVLNNYSHADEWNGGAWLTAGSNSAVILAGNKGLGYTWYGYPDGTECPPDCDHGEGRGWWADTIVGQLLFYDPADLARVAQGTLAANRPQPYATLNIDPFLYHITSTRQKYHVSAVAYDRARNLLYIFEPFSDSDKPIVHVWAISSPVTPPVVPKGRNMAPVLHLLRDRDEQEVLREDFESWPPAGWTIVNNGGDCVWQSNTATGRPNYAGYNGKCAMADQDTCSTTDSSYNGNTMNTDLLSPVFDLSMAEEATLSYVAAYNDYLADDFDYAEVSISTNGGSTWTSLLRWEEDHDPYGPGEAVTIDLTPYAGSIRTRLRFRYYAPSWDFWWMVDQVRVTRK